MDPEAILDRAETADSAQHIDRILELFDSDIGFRLERREGAGGTGGDSSGARGADQWRRWTRRVPGRENARVASGDTIAIAFETFWDDPDGSRHEGYGSEFWMLRDGRLREWHAYYVVYVRDEEGDYLSPEQMPFTR